MASLPLLAPVSPPLPTLLSQALIAFTIELDNEWERRAPYWTTDFGGDPAGAWAVSLRQWSNFMQWVPSEGISLGELSRAARAEQTLDGMRRWRYIKVDGLILRPTRRGARAQEVWAPLVDEIEQRWRERFGAELIGGLRSALEPIVATRGTGLPDWITHFYGGYAVAPVAADDPAPGRRLPLSALFSVPLQLLALAYEREAAASLMYTANVLRPLGADVSGVAVSELPQRSGVASPALATALGILVKRGFVTVGSGRGRRARLTEKGAAELESYEPTCAAIEARAEVPPELRVLLQSLLTQDAPLWPRIDPPPESWRSRIRRPSMLPHHPMPRQGGHPDGV